MLTRLLVPLGLVALLATACGEASSAPEVKGEKEERSEEQGELDDRMLERTVTIEIEGAQDAHVEKVLTTRVVTRVGEGELAQFSLAHVGPPEFVQLGGGRRLMVEVGVVGIYTGDGTYELPAGIGPPPSKGPTVETEATGMVTSSVAAAVFVTEGDDGPSETRFGYLLEPCQVELRSDATEGNVSCPALKSVGGEEVSLTMTWEAPAKSQ
jgi:hypothetical protein